MIIIILLSFNKATQIQYNDFVKDKNTSYQTVIENDFLPQNITLPEIFNRPVAY